MAKSTVLQHAPVVGSNTTWPPLPTKKSAGVAPEVNLRNPLHAGDKACKRVIHPGFESQGKCHQKYKTGVSGLMSCKNFQKRRS